MNKKLHDLELACLFKPRYSGAESVKIWKEIGASDDRTLYDFGLAMQDAEVRFLAVLNSYVGQAVRRAYRAKRVKR